MIQLLHTFTAGEVKTLILYKPLMDIETKVVVGVSLLPTNSSTLRQVPQLYYLVRHDFLSILLQSGPWKVCKCLRI